MWRAEGQNNRLQTCYRHLASIAIGLHECTEIHSCSSYADFMQVRRGVLAQESGALMKEFFQRRRLENDKMSSENDLTTTPLSPLDPLDHRDR